MFKNEHDLFYSFGGGPYFGGGPGQLPHLPHGKSGPELEWRLRSECRWAGRTNELLV